MNIFDIAKNISQEKERLDISSLDKIYSQFMINRIMACSPDLVFLANEITKIKEIDNQTHYDLWFNVLTKRKRYFKYHKEEKIDNSQIGNIQTYFGINKELAIEYFKLLSEEELKYINESFNHGKG